MDQDTELFDRTIEAISTIYQETVSDVRQALHEVKSFDTLIILSLSAKEIGVPLKQVVEMHSTPGATLNNVSIRRVINNVRKQWNDK